MKIGITGLPKSGKTTLFNLLCGTDYETGKFAATIEQVHRGVAHVPELRLARLAPVENAPKTVEVAVEFLDFAGLSLGAERESKLIGDLRTVDAIVHVIRAFDDPEMPHPAGEVNPSRDASSHEADMIVNDLIVVENRLPRLETTIMKARTDELVREKEVLDRVKACLEDERPLREMDISGEDLRLIKGYGFLSAKPLLLALNIDEDEVGDFDAAIARWGMAAFAEKKRVDVCPMSLQLELEISRLDPGDLEDFLRDLGINELCSDRFLHFAFSLLGLITFFTVNNKEARAWPLAAGSTAIEAAGTVHSDMAKGFIRAEVISLDDIVKAGSWAEARKGGILRLEGRDYVVQEGDVVNIRFNI